MAQKRRSFNPQRRLEASGIPRAGDKSSELELMTARKFGIAPPPTHEYLPQPERFLEQPLGTNELPTWDYKDTIVTAINENPITICLAETGSGKSTQIPQYLMEEGYEVILTQPRRLAAEMLAQRIEDEVIDKVGGWGRHLVGYQTAERSTLTEDSRIQVVTDGLQLVRELGVFSRGDQETDTPRVLMIDEAHERNTNIDVLLAWAKLGLREQSSTRIVITSAGIDVERMARYFSGAGFTPPIIEVPGRSYPIERREEPDSTVVEETAKYAGRGDNVLVFLPGVNEIERTMSAVRKKLSGDKQPYQYLALHGGMSPIEQHYVELEYPHPKIVFATNVAETSITIPDVDTIIDSGLARQIEIDNEGIESLQVRAISQASCLQRSGRCGRTHPGTYVLTRLNGRVAHVPLIARDSYITPEILRSNVDRTVLRTASIDMDINNLPLMDHLKSSDISRSKKALQAIGALDEQKKTTTRGLRMDQFPVRPSFARMITYAEENNFNEDLKRLVAAMVATVESGTLPDYSSRENQDWKQLTNETDSDLVAQLDVFLRTQSINNKRELAELGLNTRSVDRARELYGKLQKRMHLDYQAAEEHPSEKQREMLRECAVAGMIDFVYERRGSEYLRTSNRIGKQVTERVLSDRSLVRGRPELIVGTPYAIASPPGKNLPEKHILQDVSKTTAKQLGRVARDLCDWQETERGSSVYSWHNGAAYTRRERVFRGSIPTGEFEEELAEWSPQLAREIIQRLREQPGRNLREMLAAKKQSEELYNLSGYTTPIHENEVTQLLEQASGLTKSSVSHKPLTLGMLDGALGPHVQKITDRLPDEEITAGIYESSPRFIEIEGISLEVGYSQGKPYVSKINDNTKSQILELEGEFLLPDGRDILIPHKVGRSSKRLTLNELHRYVERSNQIKSSQSLDGSDTLIPDEVGRSDERSSLSELHRYMKRSKKIKRFPS